MTASLAYIGDATNFFQVAAGGVSLTTTTMSINTGPLVIATAQSGSIRMGAANGNNTAPTGSGGSGILLSGSGQFSFQQGQSYLRGDSSGVEMNFPSFSIDTDGVINAQKAVINGEVRGTSGFFGESADQGWNIDGNKLRDTNSQIEIDATAGSPNISLTSGSFVAEIVPNFTQGSVILAGGGNVFGPQNALPKGNVTHADTGTITLTNGQTSADDLYLYGNFSGSSLGSVDFVNGASSNESLIPSGITTNDANLDLTADAAYKSTATLVVEVLLSTAEHARDAYSIGGNIDLSGSIQLLRSNDDKSTVNQVYKKDLSSTIFPVGTVSSSQTTFKKTFNVSVNHEWDAFPSR